MTAPFDLLELQSRKLPPCTLADVLRVLGGSFLPAVGFDQEQFDRELAELRATFDDYSKEFLPPREKCIGCDRTLAGFVGTFTWGLQHGEGTCGNCRYPARAVHFAKNTGGLTFQRILQYHPDALTAAPESETT